MTRRAYRDPKSPEAPNVVVYVACHRCTTEAPVGIFPVKHARLSVGITADGGLVVWCERHQSVVASYANGEVAAGRLRELVA